MCGIAGIIDFSGVDSTPLAAMLGALEHRGPDDAGSFTDASACLGHRRLAIVDLSPAGRQPLANETGRLQLVVNGEIYAFRELRARLEKRGHKFRSHSDSEVILHLYEEHGPACLEHIHGMFALALWDSGRRRLFLARDRMGKKPLYYTLIHGKLLFASELKALRAHPDVRPEIDPEALCAYLLLGYVPDQYSIFKNIRKLPPGGFAEFAPGCGLRTRRYYRPEITPARVRSIRRDDAVAETLVRLRRAVQKRIDAADVEVGILLSGGIDSTLIAALAAESGGRVKTFTMGFESKAFDESEPARRVAEALGTEHYNERFGPRQLLDAIPAVFAAFDEPFADASALPAFLLAKMAVSQVKTVLGGDGGDELFGGYPTLRAQRWARVLAPIPGAAALMRAAARGLPLREGYYPMAYVLPRFAAGLNLPPAARQLAWTAYVPPRRIPQILPGCTPEIPRLVQAAIAGIPSRPVEVASRLLDQRLYLPDDILVKTDRASMANSLEVRAPLLDAELVEFANGLPLPLARNKRLLRQALAQTPAAFAARRPKHGFAVPVARWLRHELRDWAEAALERLPEFGIDARAVRRIYDAHRARRGDYWRELWALLALGQWARVHGAGRS